ncbi:MAG: hypothetical protein AAB295_06940 [Chloroflexota bacterium]
MFRETRPAHGAGLALRYFAERIGVKWLYQVALDGKRDFVRDGVRCLPAWRFLAALV